MVLPQSVATFRATFLATLEVEQPKVTALSQEHFLQLSDAFGSLEKRLAYGNEKLEDGVEQGLTAAEQFYALAV